MELRLVQCACAWRRHRLWRSSTSPWRAFRAPQPALVATSRPKRPQTGAVHRVLMHAESECRFLPQLPAACADGVGRRLDRAVHVTLQGSRTGHILTSQFLPSFYFFHCRSSSAHAAGGVLQRVARVPVARGSTLATTGAARSPPLIASWCKHSGSSADAPSRRTSDREASYMPSSHPRLPSRVAAGCLHFECPRTTLCSPHRGMTPAGTDPAMVPPPSHHRPLALSLRRAGPSAVQRKLSADSICLVTGGRHGAAGQPAGTAGVAGAGPGAAAGAPPSSSPTPAARSAPALLLLLKQLLKSVGGHRSRIFQAGCVSKS